ncbi:MAG: EcsC family protein [Paracoccaceae bacterium]
MDEITIVEPVDTAAELDALVRRYRAAGGAGIKLLNALGGQAESLLEKLPEPVRDNLLDATERALNISMKLAHGTRVVPDQKPWVNTAVATAMGAAGGFSGLPGALVELPATTTLLLRSIQGAARENGFDPAAENVQFDCIRVFNSAGPLAADDGADFAFFATRLTVTGPAMQKLITTVAPRLATVMGQKLAAQTVPVLGAVAGATTNMVFTRYYQDVAQVHFGLRRLSINGDIPPEQLLEQFKTRMQLADRKT